MDEAEDIIEELEGSGVNTTELKEITSDEVKESELTKKVLLIKLRALRDSVNTKNFDRLTEMKKEAKGDYKKGTAYRKSSNKVIIAEHLLEERNYLEKEMNRSIYKKEE